MKELTPEEVVAIGTELNGYIADALERVVGSPPDHTVAMVVAFMALIDFMGEEARNTTVAEFFQIYHQLFKRLIRD